MVEPLKQTVLLVDDDFNVRRTHAKMLSRAGIELQLAPSAAHAMEILRSGREIGAVVTDLHMPGADGIELMRQIRRVDLDVPVIVVTGYPSLASAVSAIEYGAFRYLMKPVLAAELVETTRLAISMHRLAMAKRRALELLQTERLYLGDRASLEANFARALEQLWIAFQPIVDCQQREIIGYEALARSREAALMTPDALFSAAERLGRLRELGQLVRAQVVTAIKASPIETRIFVNLHATDLTDDTLYQADSEFCEHARRVVLEVTERSSLDRVKDVPDRIKQLRKLGFLIAVDDLGGGYAGLSSFSQLNPDIAKLDMSLVRGIESSPQKQSIVRSMIQVCTQELGVDIVSEGVETAAEQDMLCELGSSRQQGFLFGRPAAGFNAATWPSAAAANEVP